MARVASILVLLLAGAALSGAVSPVQKVIELLDDSKAKIQKDLEGEEKEMEEYATFCDDEISENTFAIRTATRAIEKLNAAIEDATSEIASLSDEVAALGTEVAAKEKQVDEAETVRKEDKSRFVKNEEELVGSIDELERAVQVMKRDAAFVQQSRRITDPQRRDVKKTMRVIGKILSASWVNQKDFKALKGFVQTDFAAADGDDLKLKGDQEPEEQAFESQSGGIVAQLEDLKEKAEEQLSTLRTGEMREKQTFFMMAQSLTDGKNVAKERLASAKSAIQVATEESGKAKGELMETQKNKMADETYVKSLTKQCTDSKEEWDTRQASAKEEMAVIEKATSILSDRVRAAGFLQASGKGAEDATAAGPSKEQQVRDRVVDQLRKMSRKFRSYALMEMVSAAAADPFEKIRGLVEGMIAKLVSAANEEATQKGFCDEEKAKGKASVDGKGLKIDEVSSRLDKAKATKASLEQTVKEVEAELAALDEGSATAASIRGEEHASYMSASKDFKDAAQACSDAISMLREYYEGASLTQTGASQGQKATAKAGAPTFGGAKSNSANVILSILESSAENFEKMYMQVEQEERAAVRGYNRLLIDDKVSKAAKQAEVKGATSEIKSLAVAIQKGDEDYAFTSKELSAVKDYLEKLKPQCETKSMSYQEKKSRREAEIEGLKEALSLLEGSAALVQTAPGTLRLHRVTRVA